MLRLAGVELYFQDLKRARHFYHDILSLELADETPGHHVKFKGGGSFLCLERKGAESYPSQDKAVVFFEVDDLAATVEAIGRNRIVHLEARGKTKRPSWAVLHDPEGHNVLLLQASRRDAGRKARLARKRRFR